MGLVLCHGLKLRYDGLPPRQQILAPTDWKSVVHVSGHHDASGKDFLQNGFGVLWKLTPVPGLGVHESESVYLSPHNPTDLIVIASTIFFECVAVAIE